MKIFEFEVYSFNELPEEEQESLVNGVLHMYGQSPEGEDIVNSLKKENLFLRIPLRDDSFMHIPIPLKICKTDFAMKLSMGVKDGVQQ